MKIVSVETLLSCGPYSRSGEWQQAREQIIVATCAAEWPPGSGRFSIYPESGRARGRGNGVKPLKDATIRMLTNGKKPYRELLRSGWTSPTGEWVAEYPWPLEDRAKPGNMDAAFLGEHGIICFEWETGNISSSHRSLNKIALGLLRGAIKAGVLVVPSRALYVYLTDRIGNITELEPYFQVWRSVACDDGVFQIIVIEHDETSFDVPRIPKGTDGRALG